MYKSESGFAAILFVSAIVILSVGIVGGAYYLRSVNNKPKSSNKTIPQASQVPSPIIKSQTTQPSPSANIDITANWLTYNHTLYSIKYPNGWSVNDKKADEVTFEPSQPAVGCLKDPIPCVGDGPGTESISVLIKDNPSKLSLDQYVKEDAEKLYPGEPLTDSKLTDLLSREIVNSGVPKPLIKGNHAPVYGTCEEDDLYIMNKDKILTLSLYCLPKDLAENAISTFQVK